MPDDLAARAKALHDETAKFAEDRSRDARYSRPARMRADISAFGRFTYQVGAGFMWLRRWLLGPLWRATWRAWRWGLRQYRRLWAFSVYRRMPDGVLLFSKTRAGLMILTTGAFLWWVAVPVLWCAYDSAIYAVTVRHDERIYLFGSQELDPVTGMHNIEGAKHQPWSEQDAIYFRAESNLFNNLWALIHSGGLYWPEYVGAAVPYGVSRCIVTSYGWRFRFVWFNTYSSILSVSCTPFKEG